MIDVEALAAECIAEDWDDHVPGWYREMDLNRFAAAVLEEAARAAESPDCGPDSTQRKITAQAIRALKP
jgi:hypothetical protein